MYEDIEVDTSYRYLSKVISRLKEPICILGGWAVFFTVKDNYQKQTGRIYIGSRDIDIGFDSVKSLKAAALVLEKELDFQFVSFRFYKNVHAETGKDLTENESKSLPQHMVFPIYVDPIMPYANKKVKTEIGFAPLDEPLLKNVFKNNKHRKEIREFGRGLLLPAPEILLATKLNSVLSRDQSHKRQKDICDIVSLCLYSDIETDEIIKQSKKFASNGILTKFGSTNFKDEVMYCRDILGLELNIAKSILDKIRK